ncbi:protein dpy-30 homolog [Cloeon dipterum]|uniref:Protein dpy-30 homolog n=2 Tax=Cloeon dipterum TaxID=197152 RepID=A0A8S1CA70_9INSE|nr:Hypothetical predicted protein [Cloeon dipterum]
MASVDNATPEKQPEESSDAVLSPDNNGAPEESVPELLGKAPDLAATMEEASGEPPRKKPGVELHSLPTRQYLDQTVVPILLQALSTLAKERPPDPITYLANYLHKHKGNFDSSN